MDEAEVKMLLERVIVLCLNLERFHDGPDPVEDDPIKVLRQIVDDAINVRCDADNLLEGKSISDD